jgi:DTW domain-containing protein YfiP
VLILQHPLELGHAKNSAALLQLSLSHSRTVVGEAFAALPLPQAGPDSRYTVLLYPPAHFEGHAPAPPLEPQRLQDPAGLRLVVLDATWRKSRKMLHQSACLQGLPRLVLQQTPASRYSIRKAHKPGQLSTLEATCLALEQLEPGAVQCQVLLQAFDGFVAQRAAFLNVSAGTFKNLPRGAAP